MDNFAKRIHLVSRALGLPTKKLFDLFFLLSQEKRIENNALVRLTGVSKNVLNQTKEHLSDLFEAPSANTALKEQHQESVNDFFQAGYKTEESFWEFLEDERFAHTLKLLEKYSSIRPSPDRDYDQFTATSETIARRGRLLKFFADIDGKRLAFIGDDDFNSVSIGLNGKPAKITVFEIDKRISSAINDIAQKENIEIEIVDYDARKLLPKSHLGQYDIIFTDPPYTPDGISLFLSRGIELLDPGNQAARVYLCYGNSDRAKERFIRIQKIYSDCGLMVRWIFDKFNRYHGAESIGSESSLYVLDITPQTRPTVQGEFNENIYTL